MINFRISQLIPSPGIFFAHQDALETVCKATPHPAKQHILMFQMTWFVITWVRIKRNVDILQKIWNMRHKKGKVRKKSSR